MTILHLHRALHPELQEIREIASGKHTRNPWPERIRVLAVGISVAAFVLLVLP